MGFFYVSYYLNYIKTCIQFIQIMYEILILYVRNFIVMFI